MRTSPLHDRHVALGATLAPFGGWSMPISYPGGGVVAEHAAVRTAVGVFDVSHLGKLSIHGRGAASFVNRCLTNDLNRIGASQAQYTLACNDDGGLVDDLIIYRNSDEQLLAVPNAANAERVAAMLRAAAPDGVEITDLHNDLAVLAVQGPRSADVLAELGLGDEVATLDYMWFLAHDDVVVCRTGYTGERGFELIAPAADAPALWDQLVAAARSIGGLPRRPRRPGHAAHRDGLPAARPGHHAGDQPGAGPARLGGRLGEAGVLGARRPARRARGGPAAPAARRPRDRAWRAAPGHARRA